MSALNRGWGFLASTLTQASRTINEQVVQPGMQKALDPNLRTQMSAYVSKAGEVLGEAGRQGGTALSGAMRAGSEVAKRDLGVDVGDLVRSFLITARLNCANRRNVQGAGYLEKISGTRGSGGGYSAVGSDQALNRQESGLERTETDFFDSHLGQSSNHLSTNTFNDAPPRQPSPSNLVPPTSSAPSSGRSTPLGARRKLQAEKKSETDWGEWKEE